MPPHEAVRVLFRWFLYATIGAYELLRLTYPITHTERYVDCRPGDALLLHCSTVVFVLVGIPVIVALALAGMIPVGYAALVALGLFLAPPVCTIAAAEITIRILGLRPK